MIAANAVALMSHLVLGMTCSSLPLVICVQLPPSLLHTHCRYVVAVVAVVVVVVVAVAVLVVAVSVAAAYVLCYHTKATAKFIETASPWLHRNRLMLGQTTHKEAA